MCIDNLIYSVNQDNLVDFLKLRYSMHCQFYEFPIPLIIWCTCIHSTWIQNVNNSLNQDIQYTVNQLCGQFDAFTKLFMSIHIKLQAQCNYTLLLRANNSVFEKVKY